MPRHERALAPATRRRLIASSSCVFCAEESCESTEFAAIAPHASCMRAAARAAARAGTSVPCGRGRQINHIEQ